MIEQVGGKQPGRIWSTAAVVPQIKDDCIRVVQGSHRGHIHCLADGGLRKPIKLQVSNLVRQDLNLLEETFVLFRKPSIAREILWSLRRRTLRKLVLAVYHHQVH